MANHPSTAPDVNRKATNISKPFASGSGNGSVKGFASDSGGSGKFSGFATAPAPTKKGK